MEMYAVPDGMDIDPTAWNLLKLLYFRKNGELGRPLDFNNFRRVAGESARHQHITARIDRYMQRMSIVGLEAKG